MDSGIIEPGYILSKYMLVSHLRAFTGGFNNKPS
jgi:hypothetical protein